MELEGHLLSHLAVADAGVIGITDDYRGEQPLAFIVIKEKYSDIVKRHPSGPVAEKLKKDIFDVGSILIIRTHIFQAIVFVARCKAQIQL